MSGYRLYFLGPSGRIERRIELHAQDDAKAIALADREGDGSAMELWQLGRLVKVFPRKEPHAGRG